MSKELTKTTSKDLVNPGSLGIEGMAGFDKSDFPIPTVKFLNKSSNEELQQDGTPAPINSFFHTGNKTVLNPFTFRIISVAKGEVHSDKANQGMGGMVKTIIVCGLDETTKEMFLMRISSAFSYWEFRGRVLPIIRSAVKAGNNILDIVFQGDKDVKESENFGKVTFAVFKLKEVKPLESPLRGELLAQQVELTAMVQERMDTKEDSDLKEGGEDARTKEVKSKPTKEVSGTLNVDDIELPA